jgi:hypothetical protein
MTDAEYKVLARVVARHEAKLGRLREGTPDGGGE